MSTKKYDFVCSLGGNCSAAHNLRYRNLRYYSLPFDWCYFKEEKPIKIFKECIEKDDFSNICLKENLENIGFNESHPDKIQYRDNYSGYIFVNHFTKTIEDGGYKPVKIKLDRRIKRLVNLIENCNTGLFIISTSFEYDTDVVFELSKTLKEKYKDKKFDIEVIMFNCKENSYSTIENVNIRKYIRDMNDYDFFKTNVEWSFLDNININFKTEPGLKIKKFSIKPIKRGISINLFPQIRTIFYFKIYFIFRLFFTIGKEQN